MSPEVWVLLDDQGFPGHSVSDWGFVRNNDTGRLLAQSANQQGFIKVSITLGRDERRTIQVNRLVARAFVPGESDTFNNIIHLNGEKAHTFSTNLQWRPRWFALKYHQQYLDREPFVPEPVIDVDSGVEYDDSRVAAKRFGLLEKDIFRSTCMSDLRVFPTMQRFAIRR